MAKVRFDFRLDPQLAQNLRSYLALERNRQTTMQSIGRPASMTDLVEELLKLGLRSRLQQLRQIPVTAK